jgi:hypothetical protein
MGLFRARFLIEHAWAINGLAGVSAFQAANRRPRQSGDSYPLLRKDWPTGHELPQIFDPGSRGRNKRERLALVLCGGTNGMVAGRPRV